MSTSDDLNELRRQATLSVHENSPAILRVDEDAPKAQGKGELSLETQPAENDHHDWQLVDERCISQCGSSPRCLSHIDLDNQEESTALLPAVPAALLTELQPPLDSPQEESEAASEAETHTDDLNEGHHMLESEFAFEAQGSDEDASEEGLPPSNPAVRDEDPESAGSLLLSGHSSYADVSMSPSNPESYDGEESDESDVPQQPALPESQPAVGASLSEVTLSDHEMALIEASSSEEFEGVTSDSDMLAHTEPSAYAGASEAAGSCEAETDRLDLTDEEGLPHGKLLFQSGAGSGSASPAAVPADTPFTDRLRQAATTSPAAAAPSASYWQQWLRQAGATRAGKLLRQLWARLQAQAAKAGTILPWEWRARIHRLLSNLERKGLARMEDTKTLLLVSGLAVVSALLAYTYCRNCSLSRALKASDAALNEHFITILELNAKLKNSVDIPITRHCGIKTSLALSHSVF